MSAYEEVWHLAGADTVPRTREERRRLDLEMDEGARRLTLLERDHRALQQAFEGQSARLAQVERRLDSFMATQALERDDLPSNDHGIHHIIARQYDAFVEQKVQGLARAAGDHTAGAVPAGAPAVLRLMSRLSSVLFGAAEPGTTGILSALGRSRLDPLAPQAARLRETALDLRQRSAETGLPYTWDFELLPGRRIDNTWQQAWPSCEPGLPGQFVIAPAYIVAEQVYSLQRVYTGESLPH